MIFFSSNILEQIQASKQTASFDSYVWMGTAGNFCKLLVELFRQLVSALLACVWNQLALLRYDPYDSFFSLI